MNRKLIIPTLMLLLLIGIVSADSTTFNSTWRTTTAMKVLLYL